MDSTYIQTLLRKKIELFLIKEHMSNRKFCKEVHISPSYLSLILNGKRKITMKVRNKIEKRFNINWYD
jgi:transcriptional regulator with XRE-family HTH domain